MFANVIILNELIESEGANPRIFLKLLNEDLSRYIHYSL